MQKIPYLLIVGNKEVEAKTISVRERGGKDHGGMSQVAFLDLIKKAA